jgi:D-amino acid aminotransferase
LKRSICYLNGRYVDAAKATISARDRGFLFGEGLFETWRTYKGRPFALREHLARMAKSARALSIPFDPGEDWHGRTLQLARKNGMLDSGGAVRLTITAGPGTVSLVPDLDGTPTRLMLFRPLEAGLAKARERGVGVHLLDSGDGVNADLRKIKSLNYLPAVMGKVAAKKHGCFESLYRLANSTILEGTTSNFFLVRNGRLWTTPVKSGVLPGVTRKITMQLARRSFEIRERRIREVDLMTADEVFLTSSSIEVLPVVRVGRKHIGNGKPGPITRKLQVAYRRNAARRLEMAVEDLGD